MLSVTVERSLSLSFSLSLSLSLSYSLYLSLSLALSVQYVDDTEARMLEMLDEMLAGDEGNDIEIGIYLFHWIV